MGDRAGYQRKDFNARKAVVELDKRRSSLLNAVGYVRSRESEFFPWLSRKLT
jgi:hypothetical protein